MHIDVWLPAKFAQDHLDRCLPSGELVDSSANRGSMCFRCTREELEEWISDSHHYSDCASEGWSIPNALGLQSSARATNKRAKEALHQLLQSKG